MLPRNCGVIAEVDEAAGLAVHYLVIGVQLGLSLFLITAFFIYAVTNAFRYMWGE